jgi:hypothetical protein
LVGIGREMVKLQKTPGSSDNVSVTPDKEVEEGIGRATAVQSKGNAPIAVAAIEALSKLFWPMVACWALLMFEKPISTALDVVAKQIPGGGASVEIAGLKINLPKSALPSAPERVKNILPKLESEDIDFIIANIGEDNTLDICHQDANLDAFKENSVFSRLNKLEMITFEKEQRLDQNGKPCAAGSKTQYKPLYNLVKSI